MNAPGSPVVSALVRTRNRPGYLREALGSVLGQTLAGIEVIVVEDGGEPHAADLAAELADPRVHVIRNETSVGVLTASRTAVEAATGRYVAFLDDDDLWDPPMLATLCGHLDDHPEAVLAFCRRRFIDSDGEPLPLSHPRLHTTGDGWSAPEGLIVPFHDEALVATVTCVAQSVVLRRDAVAWEELRPEYGTAWDRAIAWLACRDGAPAYHEPAVLSSYRIHANSSLRNPNHDFDYDVTVARALLDDRRVAEAHPGIRRDLARLLMSRALQMDPTVPRAQWRRDAWESFRLAPRPQPLRALPALFLPAPLARTVRDRWRSARRRLDPSVR